MIVPGGGRHIGPYILLHWVCYIMYMYTALLQHYPIIMLLPIGPISLLFSSSVVDNSIALVDPLKPHPSCRGRASYEICVHAYYYKQTNTNLEGLPKNSVIKILRAFWYMFNTVTVRAGFYTLTVYPLLVGSDWNMPAGSTMNILNSQS